MSDEHVSYKANLQTASTKSRATMDPPAKCFSDGVFLAGWEWPNFTCLLEASLYMHLFPDPGYGEMPQEIERL